MEKLLNMVAVGRLPFRFSERPELNEFIDIVRLAPSKPKLPSSRTLRRYLEKNVKEKQATLLQKLPLNGKLSIALDCWTSPFNQAFMAITGYFINQEWNYCEILLGFEPLHGTHNGSNLSSVIFQVLQEHEITNRILSITTDNASNNNTMMVRLQESIQSQNLSSNATIIQIPCITHVIQLSLNQLLGKMKANPVNDSIEREWSDQSMQSLQKKSDSCGIVDTLNKV
jgi:hypothetical protein